MEESNMNLQPGFRFNPFENELINFYLKPKVIGEKLSCNVVEERQLYGPNANPWEVFDPENHPWILSEVSCGKFEKIAYAFVNLTKKAANPNNKSNVGREQYIKKAGCGTWDCQTKRTEIRDFDGILIGERRMLVFEINEVSDQEGLSRVGHWRMHEYNLCGVNKDIPNLSNTVLCKITLDHSKKPAIKLRPIKTTADKNNDKNKKNTKNVDVDVCSPSTNTSVVDTGLQGISESCGAITTPICGDDGLISIDSYGTKGEEERCYQTDFVQTCDDDDVEWINSIYDQAGIGCSLLEKVENGPVSFDHCWKYDDVVQTCDDDVDWINSIFVREEGEGGNLYVNLPEFDFQSYPEPGDEQSLEDVTTNLGKRKLQAETSYAPEDTFVFLVSLLFGLGPLLGGKLLVAFAPAFRVQHTLLTGLASGIATVLGAWRPLQLLLSKENGIPPPPLISLLVLGSAVVNVSCSNLLKLPSHKRSSAFLLSAATGFSVSTLTLKSMLSCEAVGLRARLRGLHCGLQRLRLLSWSTDDPACFSSWPSTGSCCS